MPTVPPFVPFGLAPDAAAKLAKKMNRKFGMDFDKVERRAVELIEAHNPERARLILTWRWGDRTCHRDCQGRFPPNLKATLTPEYLSDLKKRCDTWAEKQGGTTQEIWVSINGPVLCWRNAEAGWTWLR